MAIAIADFSSGMSGFFLGLALPALIDGVVKSFQAETRRNIPEWPALMQLFGAFFLPTFFACLVAVNLVAFNRSRINYTLVRILLTFRYIDFLR